MNKLKQKPGLVVVLSVILVVLYLPIFNRLPFDFIIRNGNCDTGSHERIEPGKLGAIATESSICSQHGIEMFEMGGNAADAVSRFESDPMRHIMKRIFRVENQVDLNRD